MARKASADSNPSRGFSDTIGVALLAGALLLLVAQFSFDPSDLAAIQVPPNGSAHNWVGPLGARVAYAFFFVFGFSAYMLPLLLALFGVANWFNAFSYLKRRWPWGLVLVLSSVGWLYLIDRSHLNDNHSFFTHARNAISAPSIGGIIGLVLYEDFFTMLGPVGSAIVYGTLDLISLLFLTNFQLGEWLRGVWARRRGAGEEAGASEEEQVLEHRARELQKKAKELQQQADRSGLGADLKPVPEPTVRDLSVPEQRPGRSRKGPSSDQPKEPAEPAPAIPKYSVPVPLRRWMQICLIRQQI